MFKFDFDIEEADDSEEILNLGLESLNIQENSTEGSSTPDLEPFSEISLQQLLDLIPGQISYSPLSIPLSSSRKSTTLIRRDLFDARFQLISEGAGDAIDDGSAPEEHESKPKPADSTLQRQALAFLDAPSDLVPGLYEGGLKTWECSLDVIDCLESLKDGLENDKFKGKMILEVGCGTGVPSMFIFGEILSSLTSSHSASKPISIVPAQTEIHLQDYNISVLQLVTLPNMLLTWYNSDHADPYRSATNDSDVAPTIEPTDAGELQITSELKAAFLNSLEALNLTLRFFSGSWDTFKPTNAASYNIVLTSETIYRNESLQPLVNLLRTACIGEAGQTSKNDYLCLVAAKVLYFGVGGGVSDFLKIVEAEKAKVDTLLEHKAGVGRKIMRVRW